ncbi:MAG: VCBS repeat-containing protein [Bacteroidota bacterium]
MSGQDAPWSRWVIDDFSSGADGVKLGDINQDGLMDVVTGWEEGGWTKVYLHPGYENLSKPWPSVIVGRTPAVEDAVFVDLDDDGVLDVVSSTEGKDKRLYVHWGPASKQDLLDSAHWETEVIPASEGLMQFMFAMPCEVDGENGIDLMVGGKGEDAAVGWFRSPQDPRDLAQWQWVSISPATWIMSIVLADMDDDGDLDVLLSDRKPGPSQGVRWLEHPGKGGVTGQSWDSHFVGAQGLEVMFLDLQDYDRDGLEDIAATAFHQQVIFFERLDPTGRQWGQTSVPTPFPSGRAKAIKVGDMDGDGRQDLVYSSNTLGEEGRLGVMWLPSAFKAEGSGWQNVSGEEGFKFDRMELIDIDGDGDLDVLTCEENYGEDSHGLGVIWYENPNDR